jgi:hypothetical protein
MLLAAQPIYWSVATPMRSAMAASPRREYESVRPHCVCRVSRRKAAKLHSKRKNAKYFEREKSHPRLADKPYRNMVRRSAIQLFRAKIRLAEVRLLKTAV